MHRGIGGISTKTFLDGIGFSETAFMSTAKELEVALEYSGAAKGQSQTVLAMELSEVDPSRAPSPSQTFPLFLKSYVFTNLG